MKSKICRFLRVSVFALCLSLGSAAISNVVCYADNVNSNINYMISFDLDYQSVA